MMDTRALFRIAGGLVPAVLAAAACLAAPVRAAAPDEVVEYAWLDLTKDLDLASADRGDFVRKFAAGKLDTAEAEACRTANADYLARIYGEFADLDVNLNYRRYRDVVVTGMIPQDEAGPCLAPVLADALLASRARRPLEFARAAVGGMHFAARLHAGRGIDGETRKAEFAEALAALLADHLGRDAGPPALLAKFRDYLDWFATAGLDLARMYESERVQILGKYFPMYKADLDREIHVTVKIEDHFPDLPLDPHFWEYKEAENLILRFHRLVRHPIPKRLGKFREADADRARSKPVSKWLGFQVPVMMRVERAAERVELASAAAGCLIYRATKGCFPANEKELAAAGIKVPADRFGEGPVKVVGKGDLLVVYSVGANGIDDVFARDDLVFRVEMKP